MSEEEKTIEPGLKVDSPSPQGDIIKENKSSGVFLNIKRDISIKKLKNDETAIILVLQDLFRLEGQVEKLERFEKMYHDTNTKLQVNIERLNSLNINQLMIAIGGISAGYLNWFWDKKNIGMLIFCILLSLICFYVGFFRKNKQ